MVIISFKYSSLAFSIKDADIKEIKELDKYINITYIDYNIKKFNKEFCKEIVRK